MKSRLYRFTAVTLAVTTLYAAPTAALSKLRFIPPGHAKNRHWDKNENEHPHKDQNINDRRAIILIAGLGCSPDDYIMARQYGVTVENFLLASIIAQETGSGSWHNYYSSYQNRHSWKRVCRRHGVSWERVHHRMKDCYENMSDNALKTGVVLWALTAILGR